MLAEIQNARQVSGEGTRRWFTDDYFDLIVWYGDDDQVVGFQLCYDKQHRERAFTWTRAHGFQHDRIDAGEVAGHSKMTPIIVADGAFNRDAIAARFHEACTNLEPRIAALVSERLKEYPASGILPARA